jgi:hypothetical protein
VRGRVLAFAALCAVAAGVLLWLALGGEDPAAGPGAKRKPAIVARQIDRAPEIGAEQRQPEPTAPAEPEEELSPDDAPVIAVLDILQALNIPLEDQ